jgi:S1-C subfamily serine protease
MQSAPGTSVVLLVFLLAGCASNPDRTLKSERANPTSESDQERADFLAKAFRPALVILVSADANLHAKAFGTGFFIDGDGTLVTARHVAQSGVHLAAITADGKFHKVTGFIGEDRENDAAVVKIDGSGYAHFSLDTSTDQQTKRWAGLLSPTDQWGLFDRTNSVPPICSTGWVSASVGIPGIFTVMRTSIRAQHGQSGSPLVDAEGKVIGILPYIGSDGFGSIAPVKVVESILAKASSRVSSFDDRSMSGGKLPLIMDSDFRAGMEDLRRKKWVEAERRMEIVAKKYDESALPLAVDGLALFSEKKYQEAHDDLERALRISPASGVLHAMNGFCLLYLQNEQGIAELKKGIELGLDGFIPEIIAWEAVAEESAKMGRFDDALSAAAEVERINPRKGASLHRKLEGMQKRKDK